MRRPMNYYRINNIAGVFLLLGLVAVIYVLWARPCLLHWGATDKEINMSMPGDELDPDPAFLATRAITIEGTPEEIWPWLVQMGYGRAGFYGYDILENIGSPRGIHSAEQILPEFQNFKAGDEVPISAFFSLNFYALEPNRYVIWADRKGTGGFTWALYAIDERHTRLISRIRWTHHWAQPGMLAFDIFTEFTDHLAVRKVLQGVKDRVEKQTEPMIWQNLEFAAYVTTLLIFLLAIGLTIRCKLTLKRWLAAGAAGIAWLAVWYGPFPAWMGFFIAVPVTWYLCKAFRQA